MENPRNGSVGSGKIGNTVQSSRAKHWILTIPFENTSKDGLIFELKKHCLKFNLNTEIGQKTGFKHFQIYIHLKKQERLTELKKWLPDKSHLEICRNIKASEDYCAKEESAVDHYRWEHSIYDGINLIDENFFFTGRMTY